MRISPLPRYRRRVRDGQPHRGFLPVAVVRQRAHHCRPPSSAPSAAPWSCSPRMRTFTQRCCSQDIDILLTEPTGIQLHSPVTNQGLFTFGGLPPGTYSLLVNRRPAASGAPVLFAPSTSVPALVVTAGKATSAGSTVPADLASQKAQVVARFGFVRTDFRASTQACSSSTAASISTGTQVTISISLAMRSSPCAVHTSTQADGTFGQQAPRRHPLPTSRRPTTSLSRAPRARRGGQLPGRRLPVALPAHTSWPSTRRGSPGRWRSRSIPTLSTPAPHRTAATFFAPAA